MTKMSSTHAMAQIFSQAALWLTMGILAFGWIRAVLSFGNEIQLLATCLEIQVAKGHWTEMKKLPTVSEIHVKFGVRRSSSSNMSFLDISVYVLSMSFLFPFYVFLCLFFVLSMSFFVSVAAYL